MKESPKLTKVIKDIRSISYRLNKINSKDQHVTILAFKLQQEFSKLFKVIYYDFQDLLREIKQEARNSQDEKL